MALQLQDHAESPPKQGLPPGPRGPASVNTLRFWQRPVEMLQGWQREFGNVFTVKYLVFGTGVYVGEPEAIKEMFSGDQSDLLAGEANAPLSPVLGKKSVLVLDGPEHMRQRKLLLPPFQGSAVTAFREVIRDVAEAEVAGWKPGTEFVMRERMRALTFDVICRAVFGVVERERIDRLRAALVPILDTNPATFFMPKLLRLRVGPWGTLQRRMRHADDLIFAEVERRRQQADLEDRTDVLSLLLRARDEGGNALSNQELRDELVTMLAAGHETTATGLASCFDVLLRSPEVLSRLREEIAEDENDDYVNAVVTESLRLKPVLDAAERTLTKPRVFAGWELPAGIRVYPAIALTHWREDLYPDPLAFKPERFLDGGAESYSWLPFGGGIRRCIGAALAQAEMAEVIKTVVSRVELKPARPEPDPLVVHGITMSPKHGAPVIVQGPA